MATRGTLGPVYEQSETEIRNRMLAAVEAAGWRTEIGDYPYDVLAPGATEIKNLQIGLDYALRSRFARYAEGADLDESLAEVALTRLPATANRRTLVVTADPGVFIPAGRLAYAVVLDEEAEPLAYTVDAGVTFAASGSQNVQLTAQTKGTVGNLAAGTEFVFQPTIPGIRSIVDAGTTVVARDTETDAAAWERYDFKVNHTDTGGNKNDYRRWALEVEGVGKVRVVPRYDGVNTVRLFIVGNDFAPASATVVQELQTYLDPGSTGLGDGKAPAGAKVTVSPAAPLQVDLVVTGLELTSGADPADVLTAYKKAVTDYLISLVFETTANGDPRPIVYNRLQALLTFTEGVSNFDSLTVNGSTEDIQPGPEAAPVLGSVSGI